MYPAVLCRMPFGVPRGPRRVQHEQRRLGVHPLAVALGVHGVHLVVPPGVAAVHHRALALQGRNTTTLCTHSAEPSPDALLPSVSVASTCVLSCTGFAPRITASHVTITLLCASARRPRIASGENPPNTTECTAPMRAHARQATASSTTMGMYSVTVSPLPTPFFLSTLANFFTGRARRRRVSRTAHAGELPPTESRRRRRAPRRRACPARCSRC